MSWMTTQHRKKQQRAINKLMRELNNNIASDLLWKGRYCVRQYRSWWRPYWEEPGCYKLYVQFVLHDKKTHNTLLTDIKSANDWLFFNGHKLWYEMNDFILNSGVWTEEPHPTYANTTDYRGVDVCAQTIGKECTTLKQK